MNDDTPTTHHFKRKCVRIYEDGSLAAWESGPTPTALPGLYDITITPHRPAKAPGQVWQSKRYARTVLILRYSDPLWCCRVLEGDHEGLELEWVLRDIDDWVYLRDEPLPPVHDPQPGDIYHSALSGTNYVITCRKGDQVHGAGLNYPRASVIKLNILIDPSSWTKVER